MERVLIPIQPVEEAESAAESAWPEYVNIFKSLCGLPPYKGEAMQVHFQNGISLGDRLCIETSALSAIARFPDEVNCGMQVRGNPALSSSPFSQVKSKVK